jgi:site-specific DNA recombinase
MNTLVPKISNLEKLIAKALKELQNIGDIWRSSALETKRRIQKTLFPEGVLYEVKNHQYLTKTTNTFLQLTSSLSAYYNTKEKGTSQSLIEKSLSAPPSGLEPETL